MFKHSLRGCAVRERAVRRSCERSLLPTVPSLLAFRLTRQLGVYESPQINCPPPSTVHHVSRPLLPPRPLPLIVIPTPPTSRLHAATDATMLHAGLRTSLHRYPRTPAASPTARVTTAPPPRSPRSPSSASSRPSHPSSPAATRPPRTSPTRPPSPRPPPSAAAPHLRRARTRLASSS